MDRIGDEEGIGRMAKFDVTAKKGRKEMVREIELKLWLKS